MIDIKIVDRFAMDVSGEYLFQSTRPCGARPLVMTVTENLHRVSIHAPVWGATGDTVLSPFMGIGSEGYVSLGLNRKFIGFELKPSYFRVAVDNLDRSISERDSMMLV